MGMLAVALRNALRNAIISGTVASLTSTLVLAVRGHKEAGSAFAPTNAASHVLWGEQAALENEPTMRHTLAGYAIHHISSMFWAALAEFGFRALGVKRTPAKILAGSATTAATALLVDYTVTPKRLRPGYEKRLSRKSVLLVYAALALGLAAGALMHAHDADEHSR